MNNILNIPAQGALDFVSLGALVHRLDPGIIPFRKASHCDIHVSGGEFNVAANLADCFRLNTGVATAMVDYPIGDLIAERVRAMGVKPFYRRFKHDGVRGPNMATVYSDHGQGVRAPVVFYNRSNEAASQLKPGDFIWQDIFAGGVRWFHSGGIFAALSETTGELIVEAMKAAKAAGAVTSFDLNYRQKLWDIWGGESKALDVLGRIVQHVDVLVGNEEDLQKGLGLKGQDVEKTSKLDPAAFYAVIGEAVKKFPNVKCVATTLREVHSTNRHTWGAVAWLNGKTYQSPMCDLDVLDRVGGGDGYAAGFFYGLLTGAEPQEAVNLGWAHGALLTTFPGDTTMATLEQVKAFAKGGIGTHPTVAIMKTNMFDLTGETAVVIGATGVLGGALAEGLASAGAKVAVLGRNEERGLARVRAIQEAGGEAAFFKADATSRASLAEAHAQLEAKLGAPSILVNAAGGNDPKVTVTSERPFEQISTEDWVANFDLNLVGGALLPCQEFGPAMCRRGRGSIINIASAAAHVPVSRVVAYSAAKAAVLNLTKFLAREWALQGVRVNSLTPGFFPAEQNRRLLFNEDGSPTTRTHAIWGHTPMKRFGEARELVGAVVFLASPQASSFVTGTDLVVDGGYLSQTI